MFEWKNDIFSGKNRACRSVFPQISKALGHERVQFTLVGLFSGFTIAANFSRADPEVKRRKVGLFQKQLPSSKPKPFPKRIRPLIKPLPVVPNKAVAEVSKIGNYRRGELLWCMDGRANPLMDRYVVGFVLFGVVAVVTSPTTAECSVVWCGV